MHTRLLRIGFIGGGLDSAIGPVHRIAAQLDGRWRLEAGCFSVCSGTNTDTGRRWGVAEDRVHPSWRALLANERNRLDAVAVLTPIPLHAEMVIEAARAGYSVICEKALAESSEKAREIMAVVAAERSFLAVTYNYTGYPMLRELRMMCESGRLGRITQIHIEMPQESFVRLNERDEARVPREWRLQDRGIPTVALDLGTHLHHLVRFLSGQTPIEVVAVQDTFGVFPQVVDTMMCIARYTGGLCSQIWFSKAALGHRNGLRIRVFGDQGACEWYQMQPEMLGFSDNHGRSTIIDRTSESAVHACAPRYDRFKAGHPAGFVEAFANHYCDLADSLIEFRKRGCCSSPWVFSASEAEEGLRMFEAVALSAKKRSWQTVEQPSVPC